MDFTVYIDTISMGLPIVYNKGSQVEFSNVFQSLKVVLIMANSVDPDDTISMGLPVVSFKGSQVEFSKIIMYFCP